MAGLSDRVFNVRYIRRLGLVAGLATAGLVWGGFGLGTLLGSFLFGWPSWLSGLLALGGGLLGFGVAVDRVSLLGNRGLRRRVQRKLEALGEIRPDRGRRRFVGLAHPVRERVLRLETDDDVGFLEITSDGLRYRGDALSFDVPREDVEDVQLVRLGPLVPGFLRRVRVAFRSGEPFDEVCFDSREHARYSQAQRDTRLLFRELQALLRPPAAEILQPRLREAVREETEWVVLRGGETE